MCLQRTIYYLCHEPSHVSKAEGERCSNVESEVEYSCNDGPACVARYAEEGLKDGDKVEIKVDPDVKPKYTSVIKRRICWPCHLHKYGELALVTPLVVEKPKEEAPETREEEDGTDESGSDRCEQEEAHEVPGWDILNEPIFEGLGKEEASIGESIWEGWVEVGSDDLKRPAYLPLFLRPKAPRLLPRKKKSEAKRRDSASSSFP